MVVVRDWWFDVFHAWITDFYIISVKYFMQGVWRREVFVNEIQEGSTNIGFYGLAKRGVEPNDVSKYWITKLKYWKSGLKNWIKTPKYDANIGDEVLPWDSQYYWRFCTVGLIVAIFAIPLLLNYFSIIWFLNSLGKLYHVY